MDRYSISYSDGKVYIVASNEIMTANAIYDYLKQICHVNYSWCGNCEIAIDELTAFDGVIEKQVQQQHRAYMNYCTVGYSMCWWDWSRWEKELDFMALNGINMPLLTIGSEAVWFETLIKMGYSRDEAMSTISGMAFWPWQLMTNIIGYMPPQEEKYIYERLELGRKILARAIEYGMQPIQQGFAGVVPPSMRDKFPKSKIRKMQGWCKFPSCYMIDPKDELFKKFGSIYLNKLDELLGAHHYYACDPFHENGTPRSDRFYLKSVGKVISRMYSEFDSDAVWVMQSWSIRKHIIKSIEVGKLLVLDIDGTKYAKLDNFYGHKFVVGEIHNFGGKSVLHGDMRRYALNRYHRVKSSGVQNIVGSGIFMEGIDNNPMVYDLLFDSLTISDSIDINKWIDNYAYRRTGIRCGKEYNSLLENVYRDTEDHKNCNDEGSVIASIPDFAPNFTSGWDSVGIQYEDSSLDKCVQDMLELNTDNANIRDGYYYDLVDIARQSISNKFYLGQIEFNKAYKSQNVAKAKAIITSQLQLLSDMDSLLANRSEFRLSTWLESSIELATDDSERKYYLKMAKVIITLWGNYDEEIFLYDYAWREWNGMLASYYKPRWEMFYNRAMVALKRNHHFEAIVPNFISPTRPAIHKTEFGRDIIQFSKQWCESDEIYSSDIPYNDMANIKLIIDRYIKR